MCMGLMVIMVWGYVRRFGVDASLMKAGNKKKVRTKGKGLRPPAAYSSSSRWTVGRGTVRMVRMEKPCSRPQPTATVHEWVVGRGTMLRVQLWCTLCTKVN